MSDGATPCISVRNLHKRFHDHVVLRDVSFDLPWRTSMALIGPSASGKTVLLKCLLGLHVFEGGAITIDGMDLAKATGPERDELMDRIGVLFQQNALFDSLRIWENVCFRALSSKSISRRKARDRAVELLAQVGLGAEVADLGPADLSGGMQKRVGLARAIAADPEILILDDPTAGLDPILAHTIDSLIDDVVHQKGVTAIAITGEMTNIAKRYRNIALLHDGEIKWCGGTDNIDAADNAYLHQMVNGEAEGPIRMAVRD